MLWIIRQIRHFRDIFRSKDSPRQLAAGCAIGMMLGLLPKGNLLAVLFSIVMFAINVNLATAAITTLFFSVVAGLFDPITHPIGWLLLNSSSLREPWARFFRIPLAPWTALYNTVVLGSLVLGSLLAGPVYWLSKLGFSRLQSRKAADAATEQSDPSHGSAIPDEQIASDQFELHPADDAAPSEDLHPGAHQDQPVDQSARELRFNAQVHRSADPGRRSA